MHIVSKSNMKVDQFENARKTRKKAEQTFFSSTNKIGDDNYRVKKKTKKKWEKQCEKLSKTKNAS